MDYFCSMVSLENRVSAFVQTGEIMRMVARNQLPEIDQPELKKAAQKLQSLMHDSFRHNGWFTEKMVRHMIAETGESLRASKIEKWLSPYSSQISKVEPRKIAVVMAGNIPMVGFHDFLVVVMSGNKLLARLSADDDQLLPSIAGILLAAEPDLAGSIELKEGKLKGFDAVIATGSNNTARYFEYYFRKYPHIIRKNRNGVAVLDGSENERDLEALASDILLYYGLGCRNVSKLYVPGDYDFDDLLRVIGKQAYVSENHKYFNNYEYNKAIFLINKTPYLDAGNLLLVENQQVASPVSVVHYEYYEDINSLNKELKSCADQIQCVVSSVAGVEQKIELGASQKPELWDYADGVNTMEFLLKLS